MLCVLLLSTPHGELETQNFLLLPSLFQKTFNSTRWIRNSIEDLVRDAYVVLSTPHGELETRPLFMGVELEIDGFQLHTVN